MKYRGLFVAGLLFTTILLLGCNDGAGVGQLDSQDRSRVVSAMFGGLSSAPSEFSRWDRDIDIITSANLSSEMDIALRNASADISSATRLPIKISNEFSGLPLGAILSRITPELQEGKPRILFITLSKGEDVDLLLASFRDAGFEESQATRNYLILLRQNLSQFKPPVSNTCYGAALLGAFENGVRFRLEMIFVREDIRRENKIGCSYSMLAHSLVGIATSDLWPNSVFGHASLNALPQKLSEKDVALLRLLHSSEFPPGLPAQEFKRRLLKQ